MNIQSLITQYINSQPEAKRSDMETIHQLVLKIKPKAKLWFLDGKDEKGKVVSNPSIGYGSYTIHYADGKTREFYQVGLSANTAGFSIYIMSIKDKKYLSDTYSNSIGKATITGYCIKFKKLSDIHTSVLAAAVKDGFAAL
jgi:hypothetical protein